MASTGDHRCGVCGGDAGTASCDEATFVAECSHVFHFGCYAVAGSTGTCPVCGARWRQALAVTLRPAPAVQLDEVPNHRPSTLSQASTSPDHELAAATEAKATRLQSPAPAT